MPNKMAEPIIELESYGASDLPLLEKLLGNPDVMAHLGGPETPEQILQRHQRYLRLPETGTDCMFKIVLEAKAVGSIGFWEKTWRDQPVYETGWFVLPGYQGRGIATKATEAVISLARLEHKHPLMYAFPSAFNAPSNAICRKTGFELIGECDFEYPIGHSMRCNEWRLNLHHS